MQRVNHDGASDRQSSFGVHIKWNILVYEQQLPGHESQTASALQMAEGISPSLHSIQSPLTTCMTVWSVN